EYCLLNGLNSNATTNGYSTSRSLEDILVLDPQTGPLVAPLNLSTKGKVVYCVMVPIRSAIFCNNLSSPRASLRTPQIDGKEIFRQARSTLSYEQFSAFLSNIKELNCQNQTREETLRKAE
ncbi:hypothetical protein C5167_040956, partial [Papaver somniferum]